MAKFDFNSLKNKLTDTEIFKLENLKQKLPDGKTLDKVKSKLPDGHTLDKLMDKMPGTDSISNLPIDFEWLFDQALKIPTARVNREEFLRDAFKEYYSGDHLDAIVLASPINANVDKAILDKVAESNIKAETKKVTGLSFATGMGGITMMVPDMIQYLVHVMRISQILAYIYGWPSLVSSDKDKDAAARNLIVVFIGVMYGVKEAHDFIDRIAVEIAKNLGKKVATKSLTQASWYMILQQVAKAVGVKLTQDMVAKGIEKGIPVVASVVGAGIAYYSFQKGAHALHDKLRANPLDTRLLV